MIDEALLRIVSTHAGAPQAFAQRPTPMTGGYWAAIFSFELAEPPDELRGPLVLRVMPSPGGAVVETIVQRTVANHGYPTPRVVVDGTDEAVGGAYMVMQRVEGVALLAGLSIGRTLWTLPKTVRRVASQLSVASVRLHDLDPQPVIDALDEADVDVASLGVAGRINEIRGAAERSLAGFDELLAWLDRGRPALTPAVVCHGDIHPFNMLMTDDDSFYVLDWTNANLCRRELDVGFTAALLQCAPIDVPSVAKKPLGALTGALARRFIDTYRRMAPINLDVVEWFEVLQYGRCLAAVATTSTDDAIIGRSHPFRISAPAMIRQLRIITGVQIVLPAA
ncbi:MAG TPA: phosphotransferase [Ilumatobacteraceae bacterium]|nr:phosphotransferase [Ilumatobacteraceae bacterium]